MDIPKGALSATMAITSEQKLVFFVHLAALETGTSIMVSSSGAYDENELAHMWLDLSAMVMESLINPDMASFGWSVPDADGKQKGHPDDISEIPF